MKSKFSYRTYLYVIFTIFSIAVAISLFINSKETFGEDVVMKLFFIGSLLLFTNLFLISGLIKRVISVTLSEQEINIKNFLFKERKIFFTDLDGFETTIETSRAGDYEVLLLIKDKKIILQLSQFHISNYFELKDFIKTKTTDLGFIPSNILNDLKRYF
ncbi:hypothetical protein [Flavobacterium quisquiliarum]|uniref:PH domain-containing protein n=1 Tax=Flavobacterium quisquiliarum TaxID=1834436 RepID=A0ABV8W472_9FLAO|nr:hypothetical protein [Flavobacterium quisquiliarum]MBW1658810.1 hypothetical protein [Flavobacterium quisquiliarum]NWL02947.1 hypothetical protein [Flavobacterium collinsii]